MGQEIRNKDKKKLKKMEENISEEKLNMRQEKFCQLYSTSEEFFGNGVQAYMEVYDIDKTKPNWFGTACSAASRLLSNVKVCRRINELLEEQGLNDGYIDKQLLFLVTQHADFGSKLGAIKEYNKLRQRIVNKSDITSNGEPIKVNLINYGDNNPKQIPTEGISDTNIQSN